METKGCGEREIEGRERERKVPVSISNNRSLETYIPSITSDPLTLKWSQQGGKGDFGTWTLGDFGNLNHNSSSLTHLITFKETETLKFYVHM